MRMRMSLLRKYGHTKVIFLLACCAYRTYTDMVMFDTQASSTHAHLQDSKLDISTSDPPRLHHPRPTLCPAHPLQANRRIPSSLASTSPLAPPHPVVWSTVVPHPHPHQIQRLEE
jgi:hypothetical protein